MLSVFRGLHLPAIPVCPCVTYQRGGIGTVNAVDCDRRLGVDLCGLGETPRGDCLEARRDGAGAAGGDTAGEHVGGGIGRKVVCLERGWW
jgi:hypothetical protein